MKNQLKQRQEEQKRKEEEEMKKRIEENKDETEKIRKYHVDRLSRVIERKKKQELDLERIRNEVMCWFCF